MSPNFSDQLLSLVKDDKKKEFIASKDGNEFIKEIAIYIRDEDIAICKDQAVFYELSSMNRNNEDIKKTQDTLQQEYMERSVKIQRIQESMERSVKIQRIADIASISLDSCESYASFLYLIYYLQNPVFFILWVYEWLRKVYEKYPKSAILKFLNAFAINYYQIYKKIYTNDSPNSHETTSKPDPMKQMLLPLKKQFENLKPAQQEDSTKLFFEALRAAPVRILDLQETYAQQTENNLEKNPFYLEFLYETFGKTSFPGLSVESFFKIYISFLHAELSNYSVQAGLTDKADEELEKALLNYNDNSYALSLKARLEEDSINAECMFKHALELVDNQYVGSSLQTEIKIASYLGLGYIYHKRMIYDIAEKYCSKALDLEPEGFLEATVLLNRGRSRLDAEDFIGAKQDMNIVKKDYVLAPDAHNNLGLIYYKQGLYEKAESEFIQAIELRSDFPHPYYNLGVLYNEEGNIGKAKKLFQTALNMRKDYNEAKDALKKLQKSDISSIGDWYDWWFSANASSLKKGIGIATLILIGALIGTAGVNAILNLDIKPSMFGIIAIAIAFLVLPLLSKLKIGPVELEMESKGQQPEIVSTGIK